MVRGLANRCWDDNLLLNVPAGNMSALTDEPDHFVTYCQGIDPAFNGECKILHFTALIWRLSGNTLNEAEKISPGIRDWPCVRQLRYSVLSLCVPTPPYQWLRLDRHAYRVLPTLMATIPPSSNRSIAPQTAGYDSRLSSTICITHNPCGAAARPAYAVRAAAQVSNILRRLFTFDPHEGSLKYFEHYLTESIILSSRAQTSKLVSHT